MRPSAAGTPRTLKKRGDVRIASTRSGSDAGRLGHVLEVAAGEPRERPVRLLPFLEAARRDELRGVLLAEVELVDGDEPIGLRVWKRLEQHGIDSGKDRAVRADAQGQREDDGGGDRAAMAKAADGGDELVEHGCSTDITVRALTLDRISTMSPSALRRQIGQLLIAGFNGHQIPPELRSLAREFGLGGVILFARNIVEPEQVAEVCVRRGAAAARAAGLGVSVDQEGGRVARLKAPFTEWPPMATLGRSGDVTLAERFARALAAELKAVGITLDYAPVLDIHTNPKNPVIGDRALAEKAEEVARLGARDRPRAAGRRASPPAASIFPVTATPAPIRISSCRWSSIRPIGSARVEFVPFKAAIEAGVATIMTAHVLVPSLDEKRPATLSRRIVHRPAARRAAATRA